MIAGSCSARAARGARRRTPCSLLPLLLLLPPLRVCDVSRECVRRLSVCRNGSGVALSLGFTSSASCGIRGVMKPTASSFRRDDAAKRRPKRRSALSVELLDEMVEVGLTLSKGVELPERLRAKMDVGEMLLSLESGGWSIRLEGLLLADSCSRRTLPFHSWLITVVRSAKLSSASIDDLDLRPLASESRGPGSTYRLRLSPSQATQYTKRWRVRSIFAFRRASIIMPVRRWNSGHRVRSSNERYTFSSPALPFSSLGPTIFNRSCATSTPRAASWKISSQISTLSSMPCSASALKKAMRKLRRARVSTMASSHLDARQFRRERSVGRSCKTYSTSQAAHISNPRLLTELGRPSTLRASPTSLAPTSAPKQHSPISVVASTPDAARLS